MSNIERGTVRSAFSPEEVNAINRAYQAALRNLGEPDYHSESRAILGRYVMELAKAGETDELRLYEGALARMRRPVSEKEGPASGIDMPWRC
jgi:hypothetical protein